MKAPDEYYRLKDPLRASQQALKAAERLYSGRANMSCATCHGERGDGQGALAGQFDPPPRNFACQTVGQIPDGQLFWVIRFGSPGTAMPAHAELSDEQIWELVLYLRQLTPQAGREPAVHS